MKDMDLMILLAVFQEMMGPLLWVVLVLIAAGLAAFVALLTAERGLRSRRLVRSQALGLVGGALALVLMAKVSSSGYTNAGGPVDWLLIAFVFGIGLVGTTIVLYTLAGWWTHRA
ncbi:DUF5368 domain-containing protein [Pollutimonas sp. M17]|uniref:DUF5368 domain-containing protein n=1 Tax=Pollutimonas sp. M17 TaxID=2962065 RepID=UPI0021F4593F|nr:DUF5368 domain-containing protein [Pollutimonas sp. M17]UYO94581.1 DUF5368 domain-containing protein [Pollutimonas sp. M17]